MTAEAVATQLNAGTKYLMSQKDLNSPIELPLETSRTRLRRIELGDFDRLLAIYGDEESSKYDFYGPFGASDIEQIILSQSEIYIGDPGVPFYLGVEQSESGELIGIINLFIQNPVDRQGSIGFVFDPAFQGQGFAYEAANAALRFGFLRLELHRIVAACDSRNQRSWKLMERLGMRREAHFVHDGYDEDEGTWTDSFIYAMLDEEWRPIESSAS